MARRVFGRVEDEAKHGGRQPGASDLANFEQCLRRRLPELIQRCIDRLRCGGDERLRLRARRAFARERRPLRLAQALPSGVGEQAIEAAGEMLKVVARGCGATRPFPQLIARRIRGVLNVFPRLDERVRGRHEHRLEPGEWAAQPRLGRVQWPLGNLTGFMTIVLLASGRRY